MLGKEEEKLAVQVIQKLDAAMRLLNGNQADGAEQAEAKITDARIILKRFPEYARVDPEFAKLKNYYLKKIQEMKPILESRGVWLSKFLQ